jgi:hypothetical protein
MDFSIEGLGNLAWHEVMHPLNLIPDTLVALGIVGFAKAAKDIGDGLSDRMAPHAWNGGFASLIVAAIGFGWRSLL